MADSTREQIVAALVDRLAAIDGTPPFQTNAGAHIVRNEAPGLGPDDPDAVILVRTETDSVGWQKQNLLVELPITIAAVVKAALDEPWDAVEAIVADIKRAVEREDRRLGIENVDSRGIKRGPTSVLDREAGSSTVGVGILYAVPYAEGWGTP